jgi:hypothetical protein
METTEIKKEHNIKRLNFKKLAIFISIGIFFGIVLFFILPSSRAEGVLFWDSYEEGLVAGSFPNWTETDLYGGAGLAIAESDSSTATNGLRSAKFEVSNGTQGGWAMVSKQINWPSTKKLWYSCDFKIDDFTNAAMGGIYILEAYIKSGVYRGRADIEIVYSGGGGELGEGQVLSEETFLLRMAYRGKDGGRDGHRQMINIQAPRRNAWHNVIMLVDLSGTNPHYAWWLNGNFIWQDFDTSSGNDSTPPDYFLAGITNVDWDAGNRARVWIDNCSVSDTGPEPGGPTITPSSTFTPTPTISLTPLPTLTPQPTPDFKVITFNDLTNPDRILNGKYPAGVVNWGKNKWWLSSPYGQFTTNSISFLSSSVKKQTFSFISAKILLSLDAYNRGANSSVISISCSGNPVISQTVGAGKTVTILTNWVTACTTITLGSSNGCLTNFDNFVYR